MKYLKGAWNAPHFTALHHIAKYPLDLRTSSVEEEKSAEKKLPNQPPLFRFTPLPSPFSPPLCAAWMSALEPLTATKLLLLLLLLEAVSVLPPASVAATTWAISALFMGGAVLGAQAGWSSGAAGRDDCFFAAALSLSDHGHMSAMR